MGDRPDRMRSSDELLTASPRRPVRSGARLADVLARAARLAAVQRRLRTGMPEALARQCHVVAHERGELRILVDNPAVATQLRFRESELLAAVTASKLSIVVRPPPVPHRERPGRPHPGVPREAATHLESLARAERDPALGEALARLASRRRPGEEPAQDD